MKTRQPDTLSLVIIVAPKIYVVIERHEMKPNQITSQKRNEAVVSKNEIL